jgi:hypothetical protein
MFVLVLVTTLMAGGTMAGSSSVIIGEFRDGAECRATAQNSEVVKDANNANALFALICVDKMP